MNEELRDAYYVFDGLSFISVHSLMLAVIVIYMMFVIGTGVHEYATGQTREFPLAMLIIRVGVSLALFALISGWIGVPAELLP